MLNTSYSQWPLKGNKDDKEAHYKQVGREQLPAPDWESCGMLQKYLLERSTGKWVNLFQLTVS